MRALDYGKGHVVEHRVEGARDELVYIGADWQATLVEIASQHPVSIIPLTVAGKNRVVVNIGYGPSTFDAYPVPFEAQERFEVAEFGAGETIEEAARHALAYHVASRDDFTNVPDSESPFRFDFKTGEPIRD